MATRKTTKTTKPTTKPTTKTTTKASTTQRVQSKKTVAPRTATSTTSHDDIARRAYLLFEERGYEHGHHAEDWLAAEAELGARTV